MTDKLVFGLLKATPHLVLVIDRDLRVYSSNWRQLEHIPDEVRRSQPFCYQILRNRSEPCDNCPVQDVFMTGKAASSSDTRCRRNCANETSSEPVCDDSSNVEYVIQFITDVTPRIAAEQSLQTAAEKCRLLHDSTNAGLFRTRLVDGLVLEVSPCLTRLLGYDSTDELVNRVAARDLYVDLKQRDAILAELRSRGEIRNLDMPLRCRDGSLAWTRVWARYDRLEDSITGVMTDITAIKEAEQALRSSEERFRAVVEEGDELICQWTPEGRLVFVNSAFCRLAGRRSDEILGTTLQDCITADELARIQTITGTLSPENPTARCSLQLTDQQGDCRWYQWTCRALYDEDRKPVRYLSIGYDITDLKQAEHELSDHRLKFQQVSTVASEGILIHERGMIKECNTAFARMMECEPADLTGTNVDKVFSAETWPLSRHNIEAGVEEPYDAVIISRSGRHVDVEIVAKQFQTQDSVWRVAILRDISRRKQAERELQLVRDHLALAVSGAKLGLSEWHVLPDSIKLFSEAARMLGHDADDSVPVEFHREDLIHPEDLPRVRQAMLEHFGDRSACIDIEIRCKTRMKGWKWVQVLAKTAEEDAHGNPLQLFCVLLDIADRKQAEAELLAHQERLSEMTVELSLAEERERRRLANQLHDDIGHKLAIAKIMLEKINSRTAEDQAGPPISEVCTVINECISNARSLTFEISPPVLHEIGLAAALEWLAESTGKRHGINCVFTAPGQSRLLREDLLILLFQAARELVFNAIKHARATSIQIRLGFADDHVRLEVSDDGTGFDAAAVLNSSYRRGGFGLYSIQERLAYINGSCQVDSARGRGTRVVLKSAIDSAPALAGPSERSQNKQQPTGAAGPAQDQPGAPVRVVIVDDHDLMRQGLQSILQAEGRIEVIGEAATGRQAIEVARRLKPDVIIMDIDLPDISGIEATRSILAELSATRIIALSSHADFAYIKDMLTAGAIGYLLKDCAPGDLQRVITSTGTELTYLSSGLVKQIASGPAAAAPIAADQAGTVLTRREKDILRLLAGGHTTKGIALELGISPKTVDAHRQNIMNKLGIHNLPELTKYAINTGLLD